jgi:hypothetical protein
MTRKMTARFLFTSVDARSNGTNGMGSVHGTAQECACVRTKRLAGVERLPTTVYQFGDDDGFMMKQ